MTETKNVRWKSETLKSWVLSDRTGEHWQLTTGGNLLDLHNVHVEVLREYFRDERDQGLGRWRLPRGTRGYVVYPKVNGSVRVLEEMTGQSEIVTRESVKDDPDAWYKGVADAYFKAHPVKKPWHDAKPGEVWAVAMTDIPGTLPLTVVELRDGIFFKDPTDDAHILVTGQIDSARRIWPESKES